MPTKIVFFDCDGTLTQVKSSWEYLHRQLGLWDDQADEYQRLFRNGLIDYNEFCRRDAQLWKGTPLESMRRTIAAIPYSPGSRETLLALKEMGIRTAIVSTGLSLLTDKVRSDLGIDMAFANELTAADGLLTGEALIRVQFNRKGEIIRRLLEEAGLSAAEACAVGDGEGDVGMFQEVGLPIGFHPEKEILPFVKETIFNGSLLPVVDFIRRHL